MYKWPWQSSTDTGADSRTLYVDDLRIGSAEADYYTVAPEIGHDPSWNMESLMEGAA